MTSLYDRVVALRSNPSFGAIRGQLEVDRDHWLAAEGTDECDYPGEGKERAAVFQGLIDLVGDYPHAKAPEICGVLEKLSQRERDICELLRTGVPLKRIHTRLGISQHTARNHLKHAFRKTGTHSQVQLIALLNGGTP